MFVPLRPVVAAAAAAAAMLAGPAAPAAGQVYRARADLVQLPVLVTDRRGEPVRGLTAADFEILDGGQARPVLTFAEGAPVGESGVPLYLGILLDRSGSMEQDAREAARAVVDLVESMPEAVDVTLVEFDTSVRTSRFAPADYPQLFARVREPWPPGRETALFEAIARYVDGAAGRDGLHLLLVFTDGGDSGRGLNVDDLLGLLEVSNVLMHAIVYLEHEPLGHLRARHRYIMTTLAERTGGEAFFPSARGDVARIAARIRDLMAARYTLGYELPPEAQPGQFREVRVRLVDPARRQLRVRTRAGYAVPAP